MKTTQRREFTEENHLYEFWRNRPELIDIAIDAPFHFFQLETFVTLECNKVRRSETSMKTLLSLDQLLQSASAAEVLETISSLTPNTMIFILNEHGVVLQRIDKDTYRCRH